jgi:hypothetical protein
LEVAEVVVLVVVLIGMTMQVVVPPITIVEQLLVPVAMLMDMLLPIIMDMVLVPMSIIATAFA